MVMEVVYPLLLVYPLLRLGLAALGSVSGQCHSMPCII